MSWPHLAGRVEQGDYTDRAATGQRGEIGALASSFNHMLDGILARARRRICVSPSRTILLPCRIVRAFMSACVLRSTRHAHRAAAGCAGARS